MKPSHCLKLLWLLIAAACLLVADHSALADQSAAPAPKQASKQASGPNTPQQWIKAIAQEMAETGYKHRTSTIRTKGVVDWAAQAAQRPGLTLEDRIRLRNSCEFLLGWVPEIDHQFALWQSEALSSGALGDSLLQIAEDTRRMGVLTTAQAFAQLAPEHQQAVVQDLLVHFSEYERMIKRQHGHRISLDRIFFELLAIPLDQVEQEISQSEQVLSSMWSVPMVGAEISTNLKDLLALNEEITKGTKGRFIDYGSGYGVPGLVLTLLNPEIEYIGLEISATKLKIAREIAKRFGLKRVRFEHADFGGQDFIPPDGEFHYLFNPSDADTVYSVVQKIDRLPNAKIILLNHVLTLPKPSSDRYEGPFGIEGANKHFVFFARWH